jgi:hypothetical protein
MILFLIFYILPVILCTFFAKIERNDEIFLCGLVPVLNIILAILEVLTHTCYWIKIGVLTPICYWIKK